MEAVPPVASGCTCSCVGSVPGPVPPWGDGAGLGGVVGDRGSTIGVQLVRGTEVGTVLAADPSACVLMAVTTVVDAEATEERVDPVAVFTRDGVGLLALSATGWAVDAWMVGPCMDSLGAWGPTGSRGLAVEGLGVRLARPCVPRGLSALTEAAAAV